MKGKNYRKPVAVKVTNATKEFRAGNKPNGSSSSASNKGTLRKIKVPDNNDNSPFNETVPDATSRVWNRKM